MFTQVYLTSRQKMNGCFFQSVVRKLPPVKLSPIKLHPGKMPQTNSPWFSVTVSVRVGGNLPGSNFPRGVFLVLFQQEKQFWRQ